MSGQPQPMGQQPQQQPQFLLPNGQMAYMQPGPGQPILQTGGQLIFRPAAPGTDQQQLMFSPGRPAPACPPAPRPARPPSPGPSRPCCPPCPSPDPGSATPLLPPPCPTSPAPSPSRRCPPGAPMLAPAAP